MSFRKTETGSAGPADWKAAALDGRRARLIRVEQVRLLWKSPWPQAANIINAAIVCVVLWDAALHASLLLWLGAMAAMVLVRLYLWRRHRVLQPPPKMTRRWAHAYTAFAGLAGCLWGIVIWLPSGGGSFALDVFLAFVIGGMGAGAVAVNSAYLPAFYAYLFPSVVPLGAAFLLRGEEPYGAMVLMTFLFVGLLSIIGHSFNQSLRSGFELLIDNRLLIDELASARDRLASQVKVRTMELSQETAGRKAAELALGGALEQVVVADQSRSEFLANINHELRTPLNAVLAFSEIIKDEKYGPAGNPKYPEYAAYVHESGRQLLDCVSDIMDFARIESGAEPLRDEPMEVPGLAQSALGMAKERAHRAEVELALDCPSDLPVLIGDRRKLKQVLAHLLSNAIKFTAPGGRVALRVRLGARGGLSIEVADTGIGIASEDLVKVLTPFAQVDGKLERRHGGTGIGLPLAKSLVELHGGTLELESEVNVGTRAVIRLPAERMGSGSVEGPEVPLIG